MGPFIEPETQQFVDAIANEPSVESLSPDLARAALTRMQSTPIGRPGADIQDLALPTGPAGAVPVRIVRPRGATAPLPAVMYFHGGGWVRGDADTHDRLAREIATVSAPTGAIPSKTRFSPSDRYHSISTITRYLINANSLK